MIFRVLHETHAPFKITKRSLKTDSTDVWQHPNQQFIPKNTLHTLENQGQALTYKAAYLSIADWTSRR